MSGRHFVWTLAVLLALAGCGPQPLTVTREPVTLRLVAADSCEPPARSLAAAYEGSRPWITVTTVAFDSAIATRYLLDGEADVAFLSWFDQTAIPPDAPELWVHPFLPDGVAIIVHRDSTLTEVGLAQLREIFRGRMQEWDGMVLAVVSREEGSGVRAAFENVVMGYHPVTQNSVVVASNGAMVEYVARTPASIGYASALWLDRSTGAEVRLLPVEGVLPDAGPLADGTYPLAYPIYLATVSEPAGESREFIRWLLSHPELLL